MSDLELPELKQMGTQALQDLLNNLTQAKGFILEQAPEFCQQLIAREYVELIGWMTWGAVLGVLGMAAASFAYRRWNDIDEFCRAILCLFSAVLAFPCLWLLISGACNIMRLYVAPKVYLVEEITRMLK